MVPEGLDREIGRHTSVTEPGRRGFLPLLVVVHTPDAFSPLQIAEAADGICRSLWIIDASARSDPGYRRVMSKFGQVIDHAALTLDQLVDEVAALEPSGIVAFTDDGQVAHRVIGTTAGTGVPPGRGGRAAHRQGRPAEGPGRSRVRGPRLLDGTPRGIGRRDSHRRRNPHRRRSTQSRGNPESRRRPESAVRAGSRGRGHLSRRVKPRQGAASRDTYRADDAGALADVLAANCGEEMIVETYLGEVTPLGSQEFSDFVSVESAIVDGEVRHLAVTGRFPLADPFRGSGMFIPSQLPAELIAAIEKLAAGAALALGVRTSMMHTEIKVTPDGPRIIEVNGEGRRGSPRHPAPPGWARGHSRAALAGARARYPLPGDRTIRPDRFLPLAPAPDRARRMVASTGWTRSLHCPASIRSGPNAGPATSSIGGRAASGMSSAWGESSDVYDDLVAVRHRILDATSVEYS